MKAEQRMRDFTLTLIHILVWFEILWAVVFFAGLIFQWSGLTDQLSAAFFGSGFCVVLVLAALALLNVTTNLNIISKTQMRKVAEDELVETKPGSFIKTLGVAAVLIGLVVFSLWFAEWRLYKAKVAETMAKIESISESKLVEEAITILNKDGRIVALDEIREALSASIQTGARLSFIFPLKVKNVEIYHELTAWWSVLKENDPKISETNLPKFVPRGAERTRWEKLITGDLDSFAVPNGDNLRAFRTIKTRNGEIILLIDTGRRSDYSRGSIDKY